MGQCGLSQGEEDLINELFSHAPQESTTVVSAQVTSNDRKIWINEVAIVAQLQITPSQAWNQDINCTHPCFPQISKDVTRTFPEVNYFGLKNNLERFSKILRKLAIYFPAIGYTQGLNLVTGYLMLSGFEDEDTFTMVVKLFVHDRLLLKGLYEEGFPLLKLYCEVFWLLMEKKLPQVYTKLKTIGVQDEIWIFQWFISMFLYNFPLEVVKHLWDFILSKKDFAPVLVALGIMKVLRKAILTLQINDEMDFMEFINLTKDQQFCLRYLDFKKIFSFANSVTKLELDRAILHTQNRNNSYRTYFVASATQQRQQWQNMLKQIESDRQTFFADPQPEKYQRKNEVQVIEHIEKIVLSKYRLYNSEIKRSSVGSALKRSKASNNFSVVEGESSRQRKWMKKRPF